jgi:ribonuclease P protein component
MKYNFSYELRLTTTAQFNQVFRKARKISTELYAVFYCYNTLSYPRLGVVVPKKNVKQANRRNCFKRIIRESFRLKQHKLSGFDFVFLGYKKAENVSKKDLWNYLEKQWAELVLLPKKA